MIVRPACGAGPAMMCRGSVSALGWTGQDKVFYSVDRAAKTSVVFFGGDNCLDSATDGSKESEDILRLSHPENLLELLRGKFGHRVEGGGAAGGGDGCSNRDASRGVSVFCVQPTRIDGRVWACFDNLVPSTQSGEPARGYLRNGFAARHLALLLAFTLRHVRAPSDGPASESQDGPASGKKDAPASGADGPASGTPDGPAAGTQDEPASRSRDGPTSGSQDGRASGTPDRPASGSRDGPALGSSDRPASGRRDRPVSGGRERSGVPGAGGGEWDAESEGWLGGQRVVLVGFSKGGVCVNQIVSEMGAATFGDDPGSQLLRRVSEVHYVDAGLNCRGAYLTQHIIEMAAQSREQNAFGAPPKVFLHGTPRQWDAKARPWVVQEKDRMAKMLREEGVEVVERMYFEGEKPTLSMHFRCLDVFDPTEGTTPT